MRALLFILLLCWMTPAQADDCATLDSLMTRRKGLVERVSTWRGHQPAPEVACLVFSNLAATTGLTIVEISRLGPRCFPSVSLIQSLRTELFLIGKAEERTCRLADMNLTVSWP